MKIHQLVGTIPIVVTNEEKRFIKGHPDNVPLSALDDHELWIAQNLVRKNVYQLTNDNKNIVINNGNEIK